MFGIFKRLKDVERRLLVLENESLRKEYSKKFATRKCDPNGRYYEIESARIENGVVKIMIWCPSFGSSWEDLSDYIISVDKPEKKKITTDMIFDSEYLKKLDFNKMLYESAGYKAILLKLQMNELDSAMEKLIIPKTSKTKKK